jgi:hypothetical protein
VSYDFAVLTPEFVTSRAEVPSLYRAMCESAQGPAPAVVRAFLGELDAGLATADVSEDARGAVVCTSWASVMSSMRTMLELSRDHGLPLYDPQIDRLYDPRHRVDLELTLGDGVKVPYVSEQLLTEYIALPAVDAPFVVVQRDGDHYAQAYLRRTQPSDVECRAGGPDHHYVATTTNHDLIRDVLWQWAGGDDRWRTAVEWRRVQV